jgi:hypothetical protein
MFAREQTFAVIAFILVVPAAVFLSISLFVLDVFALAPAKGFLTSDDCQRDNTVTGWVETCCWNEYNPETGKDDKKKCQMCEDPTGSGDTTKYKCDSVRGISLPAGDLPQAETVPPIRTLPGLPAGDLPVLEQVPPPILEPVVPQETIEEPGPGLNQGTEGEPPLPVICSEEAGLEKDPETGQCVPIEQSPVTEEPEVPEEEPEEEQQQPEEEQQQPSAEEEDDNGNNDN